MNIVLTHEQADFDALAALLGVHLLDGKYIPILPSRVNRNARNFLNLYTDNLPFYSTKDLSGEPISKVTLVDTQSMVTLKGITPRTSVSVIDHHELHQPLPLNWDSLIDMVGATTTILVDQISQLNLTLNPVHATLLLLGIYEDTGSLTYASTTVRDVKAAAFLLEKGANLKVAAEFLNPALSDAQKKLADSLLENSTTQTIKGKKIIISQAEAMDLTDEISSIAHKLRDLLDPDALFLFVKNPEGIRFIARSTSDQVNVSVIARHFGGGGHDRAAAALIQPVSQELDPNEISSLIEELLQELDKAILSPITVGKIMSRKPHLIQVTTPLPEVQKLMQRYGYEGFPVLDQEKVVGLLTRRAVDRAISHKLNLPAGSLMEAGEHTLKSTDTIDQLQQMMAETGWGQIPVLDPQSGRIIGIVTRTDLLKTFPGAGNESSTPVNYSQMLEGALNPQHKELISRIIEHSHQENQPIYIVGGFVRDLLLSLPSPDFDIVVEGDAVHFAQSLAQRIGGKVVSHRKFGTAKWQIKDVFRDQASDNLDLTNLPGSVDFISARTEFYDFPSALPTVERSSIKLDLHRRDFTINTLAIRLDGNHFGELYDYWGGLNDLQKKIVRVLHPLSFVDDPTRLLRAVRFEQRFGFTIEKRTLQLMAEAHDLLHQLSGERLRHEFELSFNEKDPIKILARLDKLGLLASIQNELKWDPTFSTRIQDALEFDRFPGWQIPSALGNLDTRVALCWLIWLSSVEPAAAVQIGHRLRLSNILLDTLKSVIAISQQKERIQLLPPSKFTTEMEKLPIQGVFCLYCNSSDESFNKKLSDYAQKWRFIQPGVNGELLKARGLTPGPMYSKLLTSIRDAWIDGTVSSAGEEMKFLEKLLQGIL